MIELEEDIAGQQNLNISNRSWPHIHPLSSIVDNSQPDAIHVKEHGQDKTVSWMLMKLSLVHGYSVLGVFVTVVVAGKKIPLWLFGKDRINAREQEHSMPSRTGGGGVAVRFVTHRHRLATQKTSVN